MINKNLRNELASGIQILTLDKYYNINGLNEIILDILRLFDINYRAIAKEQAERISSDIIAFINNEYKKNSNLIKGLKFIITLDSSVDFLEKNNIYRDMDYALYLVILLKKYIEINNIQFDDLEIILNKYNQIGSFFSDKNFTHNHKDFACILFFIDLINIRKVPEKITLKNMFFNVDGIYEYIKTYIKSFKILIS